MSKNITEAPKTVVAILPFSKSEYKAQANGRTYKEGKALAAMLSTPQTRESDFHALRDALLDLSDLTRIDITHPDFIAQAYVFMTKAAHHTEPHIAADLGIDREAAQAARVHVSNLIQRIQKGEPTQEAPTAALPAPVPVSQPDAEIQPSSTVIDLNLWRQSRPRPIRTCAVQV